MKNQKYINEDLDFIFIRAQDKNGKWNSLSVRELDKQQWEDYLTRHFGDGKRFWKTLTPEVEQEEWSNEDKLGIINWLADQGAVFVMIKREAR